MATFNTRNVPVVSQENGVFKVKNQLKTQNEVQPARAVLKEVGNRVLAQHTAHGPSKELSKPVKKPVPVARVPAAKLRPSIQVKETKACRLRTQCSQQIVCKVPEKKTESHPKPSAKALSNTKPVIPECSENVSKPSNGVNVNDEKLPDLKLPSVSAPVVKEKLSDNEESIKVEQTKESNLKKDVHSAFSSTLLNCAYVVDIDRDDENDPIMLGMYAKDMYKYLREMEVKFPIIPQYLKDSKLNGKMRATLIDWVVDITLEFDMNPETLFLTVAIIDRYLQDNAMTSRNKLQLVGITAMFIASKYEEMILPDINELVYVSDNAYSKREILQMEIMMVKALDCSFGRPLPIHFLRRYSKADMVPPLIHVMAKYVMETAILEYELCHVSPSLLAAAALYTSLWLLKRKKGVWSSTLVQYSGYTAEEVTPVVKKLCFVLMNAESSKLQAIRRKYNHPKNMQVSLLPVLKQLPELAQKV